MTHTATVKPVTVKTAHGLVDIETRWGFAKGLALLTGLDRTPGQSDVYAYLQGANYGHRAITNHDVDLLASLLRRLLGAPRLAAHHTYR